MKLYKANKEQIKAGTFCGNCKNFEPVVRAVNGTLYGFCKEHKLDKLGNEISELHNTSETFVCYNARKFEEI